jgi:RNA polymerase sigma-70 factor (ECF subfamily)
MNDPSAMTPSPLVSPPDEALLIQRAQNRDKEAVSALYEAYAQAIFQYVYFRVESRATAEDLTAEVFLRMVRGLPNYQDWALPFGAWLFRIAANLVADFYRAHKKMSFTLLSDEQRSDDTDPFDRLDQQEERAHLRRALGTLSEEYQNVLILRFMKNLSHAEVGAIMNKSEAAIRSIQHRALKALGEQLGTSEKQRSYLRGLRSHE